ncbi:hypothetical protein [Longimicrobium sp.]|uniref:hypothetical protein n=1 Tax=Longimicrobium sp. TaxID=2029185 RepID=UPI002ED8B664
MFFLAEERPAFRLSLLGINIVDRRRLSTPTIPNCMDFLEAMERLKRAVTDDEIAAATGVSTNTIRRTRADPATRNYRPAPRGWAPVLARLAGERAKELLKLREELEALSRSPNA